MTRARSTRRGAHGVIHMQGDIAPEPSRRTKRQPALARQSVLELAATGWSIVACKPIPFAKEAYIARRDGVEYRLRAVEVLAACAAGWLDAHETVQFWTVGATEAGLAITDAGRAEAVRRAPVLGKAS